IKSGGSQENIENLLNGTSGIAIIHSDILFSRKEEIDSQTTSQPQIFAIASLFPEYTQILVNKGSEIEKVSELKNKKIYVGKVGSGGQINATVVLGQAGLNVEPGDLDYHPTSVTVSREDALEALCHPAKEKPDLKVDAVFRTTSSILPNSAKWKDCLKLVSLDPKLHKAIEEKYEGYEFTNLHKEDESIDLLYTRAVLTIADGEKYHLPDKIITDLTRVVHQDLPEAFYYNQPDNSTAVLFKGEGIKAELPIKHHPVATNYYEKPEFLKSDLCAEEGKPIISIAAGSGNGLYTYTSKQILQLMVEREEICAEKSKAIITHGSKDNIDRLLNGNSEMAVIQSDILFLNRSEIYSETINPPKVYAIASLFPEYTQILVNKDSNIENVIQLAGKTLYVGKVGSGGQINATMVLDQAGLDVESGNLDYYPTPVSVSRDDALEALCHPAIEKPDLKVDAVFRVTSSILPKLAKWKDCLRLVSLDTGLYEDIVKNYPYYGLTNMNIGGESINLLYTRAVLTIAIKEGSKLSPELIKKLTKSVHKELPVAFYSNQPEDSNAILFKDEKILARLPIDYHPAAEEYYKKEKLLKSKTLRVILTIIIVWVTLFLTKINTSNRSHFEQRIYGTSKFNIKGILFEFLIGLPIWLFNTVRHFFLSLWKSLNSLAFFKSPITITISGLLVFLWVAMVAILFSESDHAVSHDIPNQFDNIDTPSFLIWMLQTLTMGESPDGIVPKSMVAKTITVIIPIIGVVGAFLAVLVSSVKNKSVNERRARGLEIPPLTKHFVICGWNDHGVRVIKEIGTGVPDRPPNEIVVLDESDGDKPLEHLGLTGENIHFLRGMSSDSENLKLVSAKNARGFLVLAGKKK
ncbi:MAG: TAXI family TRAP transporter solute-binding subunit, partial [Deltaproteobacteria bacterium]|nr:TAXI family TRAP transporter solute-binding subunit [Deltaproteobacteria bacterium]